MRRMQVSLPSTSQCGAAHLALAGRPRDIAALTIIVCGRANIEFRTERACAAGLRQTHEPYSGFFQNQA